MKLQRAIREFVTGFSTISYTNGFPIEKQLILIVVGRRRINAIALYYNNADEFVSEMNWEAMRYTDEESNLVGLHMLRRNERNLATAAARGVSERVSERSESDEEMVVVS
ncbi:hypothetical protein Droror1_Dr00024069 [Drosera rotundifolia]